MTIDFEHADSGPSAPEDPRAARERAKEQRRAARAEVKAHRDAERLAFSRDAAGTVLGFTVFRDGTVEKGNPLARANPAWIQAILSPTQRLPRSAVVEVNFKNRHLRKPFGNARNIALLTVSGGMIGAGSDFFGDLSLEIITADWGETVTANSKERAVELRKLNALLQQQASRTAPPSPQASLTPPPPPPQASLTPPPPPQASRTAPPPPPQVSLTPPPPPPLPQVGPPASWHPDPHGRARLRWWDGTRWTDHTAP